MDPLLHYYNRFKSSDNFEHHMFRAGHVLQGAELNEVQSAAIARLKSVADAIFKDGDIIRDAQTSIDQDTGHTQCGAGAVYLRGAVREIAGHSFLIPTDKTVSIGLYLVERVITEVDDPNLRDPAVEVQNYQEPGAGRLQVTAVWGWQAGDVTDGQLGEFYPVYAADFGVLRVKTAPPQLDSVSQAIASYDRDSTGGDYVVSGLKVSKLPDIAGVQQYSIEAGAARVAGFAVNLPSSRRLPYPAEPVLEFIDSEPSVSTTINAQRILFDRTPVANITQVRVTARTRSEIVHGTFQGARDPLPESAVVEVIAINQGGTINAQGTGFTGGTTFVQGTDYKLTGQTIDWSLDGAEPGNGSTYQVIFHHIKTVAPTAVDDLGFTVTGAVQGTLVQTSYNVKLPRIDRLCATQEGQFVWIEGTSTSFNPVAPVVPNRHLPLAQVLQTWGPDSYLQNDGLRVVPMRELEALNQRVDLALDLIAQQRLTADASSRESAAKKGMFVDAFMNDNRRDAGIAQTAAIVEGELMLPIAAQFKRPSTDIKESVVPAGTLTTILQQTAITGSMLINPYQAFDAIPAQLLLDPPVDRFTETKTSYTSDQTKQLLSGSGLATKVTGTTTRTEVVSSTTKPAEFLRQIEVAFEIAGFGANELLESITFDGVPVVPSAV